MQLNLGQTQQNVTPVQAAVPPVQTATVDATVPAPEEVASLQLQQQTCPAPPPNKKGKSATGTPCAKAPKDDDDTRMRKVPATQSQDGLGDTYMDPEEQPGEVTPAPSCS